MRYRGITHQKRGLALLEVMIAVGLLMVAVASITTAIVAGQQQSLAAKTSIIASVAAESLLSQISQEPWDSIDSWHGYTEEVGTIVDPTGMSISGDWDSIGRNVSIAESDMFIEPLQIFIVGRKVTVITFDQDHQTLISLERFIPEPQS